MRTQEFDQTAISLFDPGDQENWEWVEAGRLAGWRFQMSAYGEPFVFFTFRLPGTGTRWWLTVLEPNMDDLTGHEQHVMRVRLDTGQRIPVVCGSSVDSSSRTPAEVRGKAAKFYLYHALRQHGHTPFSA